MHVTLFCGKLGNGLIPAVVEVNHACHLHQGPKPEPAHKNYSMETSLPRLTADQFDLIKYTILANTTVSRLKGSHADHYDQQSLAQSPLNISIECRKEYKKSPSFFPTEPKRQIQVSTSPSRLFCLPPLSTFTLSKVCIQRTHSQTVRFSVPPACKPREPPT